MANTIDKKLEIPSPAEIERHIEAHLEEVKRLCRLLRVAKEMAGPEDDQLTLVK